MNTTIKCKAKEDRDEVDHGGTYHCKEECNKMGKADHNEKKNHSC